MKKGHKGATKAVWIEWREPRTTTEKKRYGETLYENDNTARIFINTKLIKTSRDDVMTFWHEMIHVFHHFYSHKPPLTDDQEERRCRKLERIIWEVLDL